MYDPKDSTTYGFGSCIKKLLGFDSVCILVLCISIIWIDVDVVQSDSFFSTGLDSIDEYYAAASSVKDALK